MTGYERDFIYKTIPDLTRSINNLASSITERDGDNDFDTMKRIFSSAGLSYKIEPRDDKYIVIVKSDDIDLSVFFEFDLNKKLLGLYI